LLVAPCLWLAFRESIGCEHVTLADVSHRHWLWIAAGFLLTLPLMFTAHLGNTFYNPARPVSWLHSRAIHTTMLLCIAIFVVQVPWYLLRCRRMLLARLEGRRRHWVQLPLAIVFTSWALAILRTLDCAFIKSPLVSLLVAVTSVAVTVGALYLLLRDFSAPTTTRERYAKSRLGPAIRERIRRKLQTSLSRDAIYQRSDLTLGALCEAVNENPHYVSQVISQEFDSSFYDLVNGYRIEHAKRLLREQPRQTVLAIAMSVGFNSKSAFHTAFRRCTGASPSEFRCADQG
jgi:AraC-like DNA-binding protein